MKITFFSENGHTGKIPRNYPNMRTEFAWQCALNADHHNLTLTNKLDYYLDDYDLGIVIPPKNKKLNISKIRDSCNKLAFMQEGPCWLWEDYSVVDQLDYLDNLDKCDFLLCHNFDDESYFIGLTGKRTYHIKSLMIEDALMGSPWSKQERKHCIIPGNMCSWYGGATSTIIAREFDCDIYTASMGRKQENESLYGVKQIGYMNWQQWQDVISTFKYMVSLMPTYAAGTAPLNAAYFGIPCIGYEYLDTINLCHPYLGIDERNLLEAKRMANELKDPEFYKMCSESARYGYEKFYKEEVWLKRWEAIMEKEKIC